MSVTKHTPGPWRQLVTRIDDANGYQLCHLDLHGKSEDERDANRRLIAAAPELLEALVKLAALYDAMGAPTGPCRLMADAAIAKATQIPSHSQEVQL